MRPAHPPTSPPPPDAARLTAILAEIGLWLCAVRVWLAEMGEALGFDMAGLRREIRVELARASQDIEQVLFLLAVPNLRASAPVGMCSGRAYRRNVPAGFRRLGDGASALRVMRRVFASHFARGSLHQRIARLDDLLTRRDLWIARLVRRVGKGPHGSCLAPVAPLHTPRVAVSLARVIDGADTS